MREINNLIVKYKDRPVGILAETKEGRVAFQYDKEWIIQSCRRRIFRHPD